ncbi:hypothetical protein FRC03_001599 [Tulasnella sp. 419]|nr:hypothetical protein FRC03_001599 [Tulasnella sp. 419]
MMCTTFWTICSHCRTQFCEFLEPLIEPIVFIKSVKLQELKDHSSSLAVGAQLFVITEEEAPFIQEATISLVAHIPAPPTLIKWRQQVWIAGGDGSLARSLVVEIEDMFAYNFKFLTSLDVAQESCLCWLRI